VREFPPRKRKEGMGGDGGPALCGDNTWLYRVCTAKVPACACLCCRHCRRRRLVTSRRIILEVMLVLLASFGSALHTEHRACAVSVCVCMYIQHERARTRAEMLHKCKGAKAFFFAEK
jgi:hypothetical protein